MLFLLGANDTGFGKYTADITSYDYDAVMDEAGDSNGNKYTKIKEVIEKHFNLPPKPIPSKTPKLSVSPFQLQSLGSLLSPVLKKHFVQDDPEFAEKPMTFEELKLFSGFVLYITDLPPQEIDPTLLRIRDVRDRALIYVNSRYIGTLSRENAINSIPISAGLGTTLQILVENQGRINYNVADDKKVIFFEKKI